MTGWGKTPGSQSGRTPCHRIVHFEPAAGAAVDPGQLTRVRIEQALPHSLRGAPA